MVMTLIDLATGSSIESAYTEELNLAWVSRLELHGFAVVDWDLSGSSWHFVNGNGPGLVLEIA